MVNKIKTLRYKITLIVASALTLGFFLFSVLMFTHQKNNYTSYLKLTIDSISNTILKALDINMLENNREEIDAIIKRIGEQQLIKQLMIYSHQGTVYSAMKDEDKSRIFKLNSSPKCLSCHPGGKVNKELNRYETFYIEHNKKKNKQTPCTLEAIIPIYNQPKCYTASCHVHSKDDKVLGFLNIEVCTQKMEDSLTRDKYLIFSISLFFVVFLSFIIVKLIKKHVTYPINQLVEGTKQVSKGNFDFYLPVEKNDEIGELARAFEKMVRRIEAFKEELEGWNRELEKRVEEKTKKLKIAQRKILQAEKMSSLGRLAAVIAHEINNPISGLIVFINLLKKQVEKGDLSERELERMYKNLALMESEAKRCGTIVSELLAFSRKESEIIPCDINEIIEKSVSLMRLNIKDKNIVINVETEENMPKAKCDPSKMQQVFINLIQNAIDAMPMGGTITIKTKWNEKRKGISVTISDTGVGIPEEYLSHIFEPFYSTKDNGKSIGIGLFVVYGAIEQIGGRISVESEVGKGTTFKICIPSVRE